MITLPPHTSNLFQSLDFVSLGVLKQKGTIVLKQTRGSRVHQITKIVHGLELVTVSTNNRAAFRRAGLVANLQVVPPVA
jgi:hypothetical protein